MSLIALAASGLLFLLVLLPYLLYDTWAWPSYRDSHHCRPIASSEREGMILVGKVPVPHTYGHMVWECDGGEIAERSS